MPRSFGWHLLIKENYMKKISLALAALLVTLPAFAAPAHKGAMESCMKAALAKHPGDVISLEAEIENGKPIYEFDIKGKDGKEWEVECDAKTGKVTEEEEEIDIKDPRFASKAKVTLEEAKKTALAAHAGEVIESETSIEADGSISYEFDIKGKDGKEWEVEVDAVTGKIVETEEEVYQIGLD
jgi:uncharacterized membrane protein YkoI